MITIFRYALGRLRGQILGWGIGLGLYAMAMALFYDSMADQRDLLEQYMQSLPRELFAFLGGATEIFTPAGYLTLEFYSYMPLILGIFVILTASGLVAAEEENGQLDLVLAHPVSRRALFFGRLLAFLLATVATLALTWLGFVLIVGRTTLGLSPVELAAPLVSLFALLVFFGALALALSQLLPSRRLAAMVAGLVLVGSFFLTSLARLNESLERLAPLSPMNYFQTGDAMNGLKLDWLAVLLGAALVFALIAWWRFERRDIRVAGEGSWALAWPRRAEEAG
jgi:ABC-2 type transport system permease protein